MSVDKADIDLAIHKMSKDPRLGRNLPEPEQLRAYVDALEKLRPDIIQWKKYTWIGEKLKQGKFDENDAERARSGGYLGRWGGLKYNEPQDDDELDAILSTFYDAIDELDFVAIEADEEKQYNLRRSLRNCYTYLAVAQIERELGVKIDV